MINNASKMLNKCTKNVKGIFTMKRLKWKVRQIDRYIDTQACTLRLIVFIVRTGSFMYTGWIKNNVSYVWFTNHTSSFSLFQWSWKFIRIYWNLQLYLIFNLILSKSAALTYLSKSVPDNFSCFHRYILRRMVPD